MLIVALSAALKIVYKTNKMLSKKLWRSLLQIPTLPTATAVRGSKLWEPDYLVLAKTKTPEYNEVNLQIRGFDYVVLERFQKMIHQVADVMGLDVNDAWAVPSQHLVVKRFREGSALTEMEVQLRKYERNVQIIDARSHQIPLLLDALATACPRGVTLNVTEHKPEHDEIRFVPDLELLQLKESLTAMGGPRKTK